MESGRLKGLPVLWLSFTIWLIASEWASPQNNLNKRVFYQSSFSISDSYRYRLFQTKLSYVNTVENSAADQDLEPRGGRAVLIYLPWWLFSLLSFLLSLPKIRGAGQPGPSFDPSLTCLFLLQSLMESLFSSLNFKSTEWFSSKCRKAKPITYQFYYSANLKPKAK